MIFSMIDDVHQYDSIMFVASARRPEYPFESSEVFRPIDPAYVRHQVQTRRPTIYDQPMIIRDDDSDFSIPPIQTNFHSPPQTKETFLEAERKFLMNQTNDEKMRTKFNVPMAQPKRTVRRQLINNLFDVLAIAATCLTFALLYFLAKPFRRGFFCDDQTIQYPYRHDTVPMWMLALYGGLAPVLTFIIVEIWVVRPFDCGRLGSQVSLRRRRTDYLKSIMQTLLLFGLGVAICFFITEVGKRTIGRLRPYYLTMCNPIWANIQCTKTILTASGSFTVAQYITEHTCNSSATEAELKEARLSFPSGHSSYATYAFIFLFVYFEARLICPRMKFLRPFLQCLCIAVAFFTCLSRITDNKHHPTDVIGGATIGFAIAVFTAVRVGTYLWSFSIYCETEDETAKDTLPADERIPVPGIDTHRDGTLRSSDHIQLDVMNPSNSYNHFRETSAPPRNSSVNKTSRVNPVTEYIEQKV